MFNLTDFLGNVTSQGSPITGGPVNLLQGSHPWKQSQLPQLYGNMMAWATGPGGPIEQGYTGALHAGTQGLAQSYQQTGRQVGNQLAAQGVNPAMAALLMGEQRGGYAAQYGQLRGGLEQQKAADVLNLGVTGTNAIAQAVQNQQKLAFDYWAAKKQLASAGHAQSLGFLGTLAGAAATYFSGGTLAPWAAGLMAANAAANSGSQGYSGGTPANYGAGFYENPSNAAKLQGM
jgi:hypothetical protein